MTTAMPRGEEAPERELGDLVAELDGEHVTCMTLAALAMAREDDTLVRQIQQYGLRPRVETDDDLPELDWRLLEHVKAVCEHGESVSWGRLLAFTTERGDLEGRNMVLDMMQRRVAC